VSYSTYTASNQAYASNVEKTAGLPYFPPPTKVVSPVLFSLPPYAEFPRISNSGSPVSENTSSRREKAVRKKIGESKSGATLL
jgi:hypothetical protein